MNHYLILGRLVLTDQLTYFFRVLSFGRKFQVNFELSHSFFAFPSLEIDGAKEPVSVFDFVSASSHLNRTGQMNFGFGKAAEVSQCLAQIEVAICRLIFLLQRRPELCYRQIELALDCEQNAMSKQRRG